LGFKSLFFELSRVPPHELAVADSAFELETVIGSNHFGLGDYIKRYLEGPDLPFITVIKIGLRYYILGDLILQLSELKNYLKATHLHTFMQVFGKIRI